EVYPQLVPSSRGRVETTPIRSGIPELDAILGGGLTWGTGSLFIGPAGVGKSTIAAQYVAAPAAATSAPAVVRDERRRAVVRRCDPLGMRLSERIKAGSVTLEQVEPGELSPGEFSYRVCRRVEEGVRIILIDSLNGYLNAIPTANTPLIRMHEL